MAVAMLAAVLGGWLSYRGYRPSPPDAGARRFAVFVCGAAVCGAVAWRFGLSAALPGYWWLATLAAPLSMWDLEERRLPDHLVLPAYPVVAAALSATSIAGFGPPHALLRSVATTAAAVLVFGGLHVLGLGAGDLKLGVLLGGALGWLGYDQAVTAFVVCFVLAGVTVLAVRAARRTALCGGIPMGPFLCAGFLFAVFIG